MTKSSFLDSLVFFVTARDPRCSTETSGCSSGAAPSPLGPKLGSGLRPPPRFGPRGDGAAPSLHPDVSVEHLGTHCLVTLKNGGNQENTHFAVTSF